MFLTCMDANQCLTQMVPDEPDGKYLITDATDSTPILCLSGGPNGWNVTTEKGCSFRYKPESEILKNGSIFKLLYSDGRKKITVFVEDQTKDRQKYTHYRIQKGLKVTIGSAGNNSIICRLPYVESHMLSLQCQLNGQWKLTLNSTESLLYVNGKRAYDGLLKPGDLLWFMGQKIILMPDLISINNPDNKTQINSTNFEKLSHPRISSDDAYNAIAIKTYFNRSPRLSKNWKLGDITVDAPPGMISSDQQNMLMSMAPALTNGLLSLVAGFGSVFTIGNMVTNMAFPIISRKKIQKQQEDYAEKQKNAYHDYLEEIDKKINSKLAEQATYLRKLIPSAREEINDVFSSMKKLWNRRDDQDDCFVVRLGMGELPLQCNVTFPQEHFTVDENPLKDMLDEIKQKELIVRNVPISIDLRKSRCCGISGDLKSRTEQLIGLISQLCIHVGYDELKLWIIGRLNDKAKYAKRLPHTWSRDRKTHYIIETIEDFSTLGQEISNELEKRIDNGHSTEKNNLPFIVIIITDPEFLREGRLSRLLFEKKYEKTCFIALSDHTHELPRICDSIVKVAYGKAVLLRDEEETLRFEPDEQVSEYLHKLSYLMENTVLYTDDAAESIPSIVPFLQLYNTSDVEWLNIGKRWINSDASRSLRAPIGVDENGHICELDIHEKINGPHGLVAGTTGSGKSELLMTYILSMAVSYSPEEVSFLLIDYKGGGMAKTFQDLPHVSGIITNLEGASVERALKSIRSELLRRQEIFQKTQLLYNIPKMEITQYQQLYRNERVSEPIPHLIIITDEFAELKAQQPEFMQELISVSNIGRSLGVHLILSTQKPSGVVDEKIRSNSRFKICLHVESSADSNDMIRCPDAAMIYDVGRFYIDPGYGSLLLAQSGWTGAQYVPGRTEVSGAYVDVVDHTGKVTYHSTIKASSSSATHKYITQLDAVRERIANLAKAKKVFTKHLWQPPLEETIPLIKLREKYSLSIKERQLVAVLGEADDPENQSRFPVLIDLNAGRHTMIYGMVGAGRDLAIKTLLIDLMLTHSPDEVWIYIIDFAGDGLDEMKVAPHIGDVLTGNDDEKLLRLFKYLNSEIIKRKTNSEHAADCNTEKKLPTILVTIHQLNTLIGKLDALNEKDNFVTLLDEGPQYGLYFLSSAQTTTGLGFSVSNRFSQFVLLQMANDDDYSIYPHVGKLRPAQIFGRGLFRKENSIYEFQTATYEGDLIEACLSLKDKWNTDVPSSIPSMPAKVADMFVMKYATKDLPFKLPIGLDDSAIEPVYIDGTNKRVHQIVGDREAICQFVQSLIQISKASNLKTTVLDGYGIIPDSVQAHVLKQKGCADFVESFYFDRKRSQEDPESYTYENQIVIMVGMSKLLNALSQAEIVVGNLKNDAASLLGKFLTQVNVNYDYHTLFIVCDDRQGIQSIKYSIKDKEWYQSQIGENDGFVLDGDLANCPIMVYSGKVKQSQNKLYPNGYAIVSGKATYMKYVQPV